MIRIYEILILIVISFFQRVPRILSPGVKRQGLEAEHYLQVVPRSRKCGSIHPLPHTPYGLVLN
jgi:hypothetical protein